MSSALYPSLSDKNADLSSYEQILYRLDCGQWTAAREGLLTYESPVRGEGPAAFLRDMLNDQYGLNQDQQLGYLRAITRSCKLKLTLIEC